MGILLWIPENFKPVAIDEPGHEAAVAMLACAPFAPHDPWRIRLRTHKTEGGSGYADCKNDSVCQNGQAGKRKELLERAVERI